LAIILLVLAILCSGGNLFIPREPLLVFLIIFSLIGTKGRVKKNLIFVTCFVVVIMALASFQPGGLGIIFIIRLVNFIAAIAILNYFLFQPIEKFKYSLYKLLRFLPFQAILTFLFAIFLPFLFSPIQINGTTYETLGLIFNHHTMLETDLINPRPDGFFYEPGVFQFYLNLCLYLSLFVFKEFKISFLTIIAILTLQSSTGVIILVIQLIVYLLFNNTFAKYFRHWSIKFLIVICIILPVFFFVKSNIENKIVGENSGSFLARQYDFLSGVSVIINHPFLGIGFDYKNYKAIAGNFTFNGIGLDESSITAFKDRETSSNGLVFLFYSIGIPLSLVFIYGTFRQHFLPDKIVIGSILLTTLFGEMLVFTPFFLFFIFSGLIPEKSFQTKSLETSHIS
jgi:hypothetical protein